MSEKEFRTFIIKIICELKNHLNDQIQAKIDHSNNEIREWIQVAKEYFKRDIETMKKTEILEMKDTINQIKNSIESINNRLDHWEKRTSDKEDKVYNQEIKSWPHSEDS